MFIFRYREVSVFILEIFVNVYMLFMLYLVVIIRYFKYVIGLCFDIVFVIWCVVVVWIVLDFNN